MNDRQYYHDLLVIIRNQLDDNKKYRSREILTIMKTFGLKNKVLIALKYNKSLAVLKYCKRGNNYVYWK